MPALTALGLPGPTVKTNTAVALAAGALANLLLLDRRRRGRVLAGRVLAALEATIGGLTLSEHVVGWDLGIDQLLATESAGALATASPNRMGPPAATANLLLGLSMLFGSTSRDSLQRIGHGFAAITCVIALLPLVGFAYGVSVLYGIARYTGIALSTAVALCGLALAVLASRPDRGLFGLLGRRDEVGRFARMMLASAVLLPLGLGWLLARALQAQALDGAFAISLMALVLIVGPAALIWRAGIQLATSIDARLATERALSESERSLRESDRQKTEFLATLSHELRNPLAPIRFAVELLDGPADTAQRARLTIRRQVTHLSRLIDDLLDLTRISRNKLELQMRPVELATVVHDAIDAVRGEAERAGHRLDILVPAEPVWLTADPDRVVQILTNLLNNAIRYTDSGGTVTIGAALRGSEVEIFVRDTGVGIDRGDLERVFERFVQVGSGRHGGLGIGLALVRGLVELHGGSVTAHSDGPGKGSEFRITLARAAAPADSSPAGTPDSEAVLPGLRILVADDNVDGADMMGTILVQRGHEVASAHSGEEALRLAATFQPQVAILDIGMPGIDGYELARRLRREPATRDALLVAITGWGQDEDRRRAAAAGFDAHLTKPADPELVLRLLAERFAERGSKA
jgi:signal transduction histidine kinase/ActR/RegA family two-component response regulator